MLVSTDAKVWLMRQIISTGLLNLKIEKRTEEVTENFSVRNDKGERINISELNGKVIH
ncbi:hypothetical protein [Chryseobacterium wanjuense]